MLKAIVKDEAELKSLETQEGYQVHFEEGDEAMVGGVRLILIGSKWVDYEARMKAIVEAEIAKAKVEAKAEA